MQEGARLALPKKRHPDQVIIGRRPLVLPLLMTDPLVLLKQDPFTREDHPVQRKGQSVDIVMQEEKIQALHFQVAAVTVIVAVLIVHPPLLMQGSNLV